MVSVLVANGWTGAKAVLDSGDEVIILNSGQAVVAANLSLHEGATDYQVPAGKTFTLLGIFVTQVDTAKTITLFQADDADGNTNQVTKYVVALPAGLDINSVGYLPISGTIAAEKFCNVISSSATGTDPNVSVVGVES